MIRHIDIQKFGCFDGFDWRASVRDRGGNAAQFKRLNILFGRNYAGKTTLSRLIRSLEVDRFPEKISSPQFRIGTASDGDLGEQDLSSFPYSVRVYNKDFVRENLSFLHDNEGEISAFSVVVGKENTANATTLATLRSELGKTEPLSGLRAEQAHAKTRASLAFRRRQDAEKAIEDRLRERAKSIKLSPDRPIPDYTITHIRRDIAEVEKAEDSLLDADERAGLASLTKENELPEIKTDQLSFHPKLHELTSQASALVESKLAPTERIAELLHDAALQEWVRQGMSISSNRSRCGFCGNFIDEDRWRQLNAHFDQQSDELRERLESALEEVEAEIGCLDDICPVDQDAFYSSLHNAFQTQRERLDKEVRRYRVGLEVVAEAVKERIKDVFTERPFPSVSDNSSQLAAALAAVVDLARRNNEMTASLAERKQRARDRLRLDEVARFIKEIDLPGLRTALTEAQREEKAATADHDAVDGKITDLQVRIEDLEQKGSDETAGAEKVNEYLTHAFGHDALQLTPAESATSRGGKFRITRGSKPAFDLSEGECTLVAFCYFIARLEEAGNERENTIIYIDDPVSSLDTNHIYFIFSLIEATLARPVKTTDGNRYRYRQLFVSTHNLEFLKYLKRLSFPRSNENSEGQRKRPDRAYFLVERTTEGSRIRLMPRYLQDYTTEFNYLFHQIYRCAKADAETRDDVRFYSFGNDLRKFLEAYLFYRYPSQGDGQDRTSKLRRFFGDDTIATVTTTRMTNELSHLEEIFDRSMQPLDVPEMQRLARFILQTMRAKDGPQYEALLDSIGAIPEDDEW